MIFNFFCEICNKYYSKLITMRNTIAQNPICEVCNGKLKRELSAPSSNSIEIIDNGIMEKKIEFDSKKVNELKKDSKKMKKNFLKK